MAKRHGVMVVLAALGLVVGLSGAARAARDDAANAIIDKAIAAAGGQEQLGKLKAFSWTLKGTISFMDTDKIEASYDSGVLTLKIPIAEQAKPRRIAVTGTDTHKQINA